MRLGKLDLIFARRFMKKLFLVLLFIAFSVSTCGWPEAATIYYMRADGAAANVGAATGPCSTIDSTMNLTIHNAGTFSPGDTIVNCGDTIGGIVRGSLIVPFGGSAGLPVSYTCASAPCTISGALIQTAGNWTETAPPGSNIWTTADLVQPYEVWFDGIKGTLVANAGAVDSDKDWFWELNVLTIWSVGNPATTYVTPGVEVSYYDEPLKIDTKSFITIDGLILERGNTRGILFGGGAASNVTIKNSTIRYTANPAGDAVRLATNTGGDHLFESNTIHNNMGFGINVAASHATSGHENIFRSNTIYNIGKDGITLNGSYAIAESNTVYNCGQILTSGDGIHLYDSGNTAEGDYNIIRYNEVYNIASTAVTEGHGIAGDVYTDHNQIYYNIIHGNQGGCVHLYKSTDINAYNNTCYGNVQNASHSIPGEISLYDDAGAPADRTANINVKNNAVYATAAGAYAIYIPALVTDNAGISFNTNNWYKASGNWYFNGVGGNNLATWNALSYIGTDLNADPLFISASDFHLQSASTLINAGMDVGLVRDYLGNPKSGTAWDIGAYEFQQDKGGLTPSMGMSP